MVAPVVACRLLLIFAALSGEASAPERADEGTIDVLYRALDAMRENARFDRLERSGPLQKLAGDRAQRLATERSKGRMRHPVPLDDALDDIPELAGRRVVERVVVVPATVERSERLRAAWDNPDSGALAVDPEVTAVGLGASLLGETLVFLALFEIGTPATDRETIEREIVEQINAIRREHELRELALDDALLAVARAHSTTMLEEDFMGHESPDGSMPADRVRAAGIRFRLVGENVARSERALGAVRGVIEEWMDSPLHRHNILTPDFTRTAVGAAIGDDGRVYLTQLFRQP